MVGLMCAGALSFAACTSTAPKAKPVAPAAAHPPSEPSGESAAVSSAPAAAHEVGVLSRKTLGPFSANDANGGLVAWISRKERGPGQELYVVPLLVDGAPFREPRSVADVPAEVTSMIVRPAGGARHGWDVAWSALLDRGEALTVLGVAPDGTARGTPGDVQRTADHVRWEDVVPTSRGSVCVWAEETPSGDANLLAVALDRDGRAQGMPARVATRVDAWQAVPERDGAALLLLRLVPDDEGPSRGTLGWLKLDADARPLGDPLPIVSTPTVTGDVEVVPSGDGWLFAWTGRSAEDSEVQVTRLDAEGHVDPPAPALHAVGGSSLVAIAGGPRGAALAWHPPRTRERVERELRFSWLPSTGDRAARPGRTLEVGSGAPPELVPTDDGFALLAPAHVCLAAAAQVPCRGPIAPIFVRLDATLTPVQTEPFFVGAQSRDMAAIGWGLHCFAGNRCTALAAPSAAPTPVSAIDLPTRNSPFAPPVAPDAPPGAPRVTGVSTLASGQAFEAVAAATVGDVTLVTALAEDADARGLRSSHGADSAAHAAHLELRVVDREGSLVAAGRTLAAHPLPVGGVAMAAGGAPEDGAAVAWVAREHGDPEVNLARLDGAGRTIRAARLTNSKGDASDVALAWAGNGWMVAWVDARDGQGEVYATKVDRDFNRLGRDQRITNAPGDAGGVALAVAGDIAWIAWSDPRDSPRDGVADIFVAKLQSADASLASREVRVLATARHSRSPSIVATRDGGAVVAWIEAAPTGIEGSTDALVAKLDASGAVDGAPTPWSCEAASGPATHPTAIALGAARASVRAVAACAARDGLSLQASRVGLDGHLEGVPVALFDLDAPASFEIALVLSGDGLVFDDLGRSRHDHRVRRAALRWPM